MVSELRPRGGLGIAAALRAALSGRGIALAATFVGCGVLGGIFGEAGIAPRAARSADGREAPAVKDETRLDRVPARAAPSAGESVVARQPGEIPVKSVKTIAVVPWGAAEAEPVASGAGGADPVPQPARTPAQARAETLPPQRDATAPAPSQAEALDGPWGVQLASERSESDALAAFERIRQEHQAILGDAQPQVTKAELGAKGIYYRVRVGARSQEAANRLCAALQAAGGSCWVRRN